MKIFSIRTMAVLSISFLILTILSGCRSREHMSPDFGVKTREFMAKQWVNEEASEEPVQGLDSEEASIIQGNYRKNIGGQEKESKDSGSRVLLVEESEKK